ncbi:MAG: 5-carboxymethyl-2-hydroxymuconate Delta-isomerase [Cystobacter sp.]
MPHLHLEYTRNLTLDTHQTMLRLNEALVASGHFEENTIKARATRLDDFLVGTVQPASKRAFIHVRLGILSGRTPAIKKQLADLMVSTLRQGGPWPEGVQVQLTAQLIDMEREIYGKTVF